MTHFNLVPGLLRHKNGFRHERNLFALFGNEGASFIDRGVSSWERLAIMQHYGLPTRLLDWTESIHTALFFATMDTLTMKVGRPCIWILNPFRLNYIAVGQNFVFDDDDRLPYDYYSCIKDNAWPYDLPIAIAAPWRNPRVKAQKGFFTFHGNIQRPLNEIAKGCASKVDIPPHLVREVLKNLQASGTDHFRMFPDPSGLALKLRRQFKLYK